MHNSERVLHTVFFCRFMCTCNFPQISKQKIIKMGEKRFLENKNKNFKYFML